MGEWENNVKSGWGKLTHTDGDIYEGEWENDQENGKGIYYHGNGSVYRGNWENDLQNGKGSESWADGAKYQGEYSKGKKHGYGNLKFADGSNYEGYLEQNNLHRYGTYFWTDESKYNGEWENNLMHGKSTMVWADDRKFSGEYEKEKKCGKGQFMWADGRKYKGGWVAGKQNGIGIYYLQNKEAKIGMWNMGRRKFWIEDFQFNQEIVLEKPFEIIQILQQKLFDLNLKLENQIQIALHQSNQKIRLPPIKLLDGAIYEGEWRNVMKDGIGKISFPDGSIYEGELESNLKHGQGKLTQSNGTFIEGQWMNNLLIQENKNQEKLNLQKSDEANETFFSQYLKPVIIQINIIKSNKINNLQEYPKIVRLRISIRVLLLSQCYNIIIFCFAKKKNNTYDLQSDNYNINLFTFGTEVLTHQFNQLLIRFFICFLLRSQIFQQVRNQKART